MELYESITRIMEVYGLTFDESFTYFVVALFGCLGGCFFLLSVFFDLCRYLYRGMKKLLRFIIRRIRHRAKIRL